MTLRWYRMPRVVVLKPSTSVLEAARAIENNNIGAIVVQDKGRVVGLVTDRDLAIRVLGRGLDPTTTTLAEVMTTPVAVLTPSDSREEALRLMRDRNIRRIPLVEGQRVVGIVTFDDLLLDEAASLDELAAIIEGQIGEGGPAGSPRSPAARRRAGRAQSTYGRLLNRVRTTTGLDSSEQAETALEIVLTAIVSRLTPQEARDLIAQLPSLLQPTLRPAATGPDKSITREAVETELADQLGLTPARASEVLEGVGAVIAQSVSQGQVEDMQRQLPEGLREIFSAPIPVGT
jgi:CBS domain-containing protein/uncharacterized protein (DUF2267 family)